MNARFNSMRLMPIVTLVLFLLLLASVEAQTPASKITSDGFNNQSELLLDQYQFPARKKSVSLRPVGFRLMPEPRAGVNANAMTLLAGPNLQVLGSGTVGRLPKWTGITSSNSLIGDSTIFEDKFGLVGIGTDTPTSKLTVRGMIEITLGGLKFPDGTVQTTAGIASVFHDATLTGNGTQASPLGVAVPLNLTGAVSTPGVSRFVLSLTNTGESGSGLLVIAGSLNANIPGFDRGGTGIRVQAGGGIGDGGNGAEIFGGTANGVGGDGVAASGGASAGNEAGGIGVRATGGESVSHIGGAGVVANGGKPGGDGVVAKGGSNSGNGFAGAGVTTSGGNSGGFGGPGVSALGGASTGGKGGAGVATLGGNSGDGFDGGAGVFTVGGSGNGAGKRGGPGIEASGGNGGNGAIAGLAGKFNGDVEVSGALNVTGTKNFKIDHPLDPENKYLYHAAIESSEVLNIYSGNVRLDANGKATVKLPPWFEALNKDFRYTLTPIGAPGRSLYIAEEVSNNQFKIAGGQPGAKVSWQVTGQRADATIRKNPFKAEEDKPETERGTYLSPEAHGQSKERSVQRALKPRDDAADEGRTKRQSIRRARALSIP